MNACLNRILLRARVDSEATRGLPRFAGGLDEGRYGRCYAVQILPPSFSSSSSHALGNKTVPVAHGLESTPAEGGTLEYKAVPKMGRYGTANAREMVASV